MLIGTLGAACISSSAILVTLAHVGAITTAFFRCALALPILVPLAVLEQRRLGPRPLASRLAAVTAGLFLAIDLVLWNHAIADVGAGVATVLGNLQVLFVAVFAWLVLRERPGRRYLVMLPVVLAGVVLVAGMVGSHASGLHPLAGIGFGVGTSAAYACFLLILRTTCGQTPARGWPARGRHYRRDGGRRPAWPDRSVAFSSTSAGRRSAGCCSWHCSVETSAGCSSLRRCRCSRRQCPRSCCYCSRLRRWCSPTSCSASGRRWSRMRARCWCASAGVLAAVARQPTHGERNVARR